MSIMVREVTEPDFVQWCELYREYREFYQLAPDDGVVTRTWRWVSGREHGFIGLVALGDDGNLVGLANLRPFPRPSAGEVGLYLDDLFTSPRARRKGVASALLAKAGEEGRRGGARIVRWITASSNDTARSLYDQLATPTAWVTYDMSTTE